MLEEIGGGGGDKVVFLKTGYKIQERLLSSFSLEILQTDIRLVLEVLSTVIIVIH